MGSRQPQKPHTGARPGKKAEKKRQKTIANFVKKSTSKITKNTNDNQSGSKATPTRPHDHADESKDGSSDGIQCQITDMMRASGRRDNNTGASNAQIAKSGLNNSRTDSKATPTRPHGHTDESKDGSSDGIQRQITDMMRASGRRDDEPACADEDEADEDGLGLLSRNVQRHQSVPKSQEPYIVYADDNDQHGIAINVHFNSLDTDKTPHYLAYPEDVVDNRTAAQHILRNFDDEYFKGLSGPVDRERKAHCATAWRETFELHGAPMDFVEDGHKDAPVYTMYDPGNGLPLALKGASGASPDSYQQLGFYHGELSRHHPSSVHPRTAASNWAISNRFTAHDEMLTAGCHRAIWDTATPWAQRKGRVRWFLNAMDNLAAARQVDPCYHGGSGQGRVDHYGKQDPEELRASALFWAHPTGRDERMAKLIAKRRTRRGVKVDSSRYFHALQESIQTKDKDKPERAARRKRQYNELVEAFGRAASEHASRPSKEKIQRYFFHHGVLWIFHDSQRQYLPGEGHWTVAHLFAVAREEVKTGFKQCNKTAMDLGLDEPELYDEDNWARVILPILIELLGRLAVAEEAARKGREELARGGGKKYIHDEHDPDFMDEVAYMLTDKMGNPIMFACHHYHRFVHDSLGDPRFAKTSGYGHLRLNGTLKHDRPGEFDLVGSLDMRRRQVSFSSNATNMIQGKQHPSLFPANRARLLSTVTHGPLSRLDESLGERPWLSPSPEGHTGTAPRYPFSTPLPPVPAREIVTQPFDEQDRPRRLLQSCASPECQGSGTCQDVPPGTLLRHYIARHCGEDSELAHRCPDCGSRFYSEELLADHRAMSCLMAEGHLRAAFDFWQNYGHHVGGKRGAKCGHGPGGVRHYWLFHLNDHLRLCGIPTDQREYRYACGCLVFWSDQKAQVKRHQLGKDHKKQTELLQDPAKHKVCGECGLCLSNDPSLVKLHKKWCAVIRRHNDRADDTTTTIIPDGAQAARGQEAGLQLLRKICSGEASKLCGSIANATPSDALPEDGHCGTCLQKLPRTQRSEERHKGTDAHTQAEKLLRSFGSARAGDAAAIRRLRTAYDGDNPQAVSEFLAGYFRVEIPDDDEEFCLKVETHLDIYSPGKNQKWTETILPRLKRLDGRYTPGPCDCVDCCAPNIARYPSEVPASQHWTSKGHLQAAGFVDSMLASMKLVDTADVRNRVAAVREIQRRYNAHRQAKQLVLKRGPQDSGGTGPKRQRTR